MIYHFASYKQIFTFVYKFIFSHALDFIYFFSLHYMALYVHYVLGNKLPSSFDNFFPWSTIHNMTELHANITTCHKHLPEHNFPPVHHTMQSQLYGIICNCPHKQQNREHASRK